MPKSAKKRKDKAADFSKAKLKLGKGKQTATNAIDTSFKARSIALPSQSITQHKDTSAPTTKRRLTFEDLLSQLKHYSPGIRKDAVLGLRELLDANWELLESCLTSLINATVRIIGDDDAGVRKVLLAFYGWLLPRIPIEDLLPHSPLLLLFATSAQTHIFPEIRIDAIRFLNIFLQCIPEAVVEGWNEDKKGHGSRVLEAYLGILNAGTKYGETEGPLKATSTASVVLTPASRLVVLQSLSTFLRHGLSDRTRGSIRPDSSKLHAWYLRNSFRTSSAYSAFEEVLQSSSQQDIQIERQRIWQAEVDASENLEDFPYCYPLAKPSSYTHWTLDDVTNVLSSSGNLEISDDTQQSGAAFVGHLARTLHSTLVATFLDYAPSVFSPSATPTETEVHLVVAVAEIVCHLYEAILQTPENIPEVHAQNLESILGYMTPYFPFRLSGSRDIKLEQAFQDLNLIFCELTSLLIISAQNGLSQQGRRGKSRHAARSTHRFKNTLSIQMFAVSAYVIKLLRNGTGSQVSQPLSPLAYIALLPTIWALLNNPIANHKETATDVLQATAEHAIKTFSKSPCKRMTIEFISRLILLDSEPQYLGYFRLGRDTAEDQKFEDWLLHLPQTLWEVGGGNPSTSEVILRALLRILQRRSTLVNPKNVVALRSRLTPIFSITHAVRGQILGPYSKLPSSLLRRLALDVCGTVLLICGGNDEGLTAAVDLAVAGTQEESYWAHVQQFAS
ncbi:hypothetical protein BDQ12DRAFT_678857 [Crucibulum laeve]|uniref:Pre-rRNA-processing protein n=1 Tax=Crucibulum laeve TaxID=68775 RepID=A0A5C3M6U6_9AGAR|nr:hypothetical protein BDQ12DRAFT_678857 [Crucibulum laeve]